MMDKCVNGQRLLKQRPQLVTAATTTLCYMTAFTVYPVSKNISDACSSVE